jgi:hypothetical protein
MTHRRAMRSLLILGLTACTLVYGAELLEDSAAGLGRTGRWFTYNGQPIYLIGYDMQELAADPTIDYNAVLDLFVQYRLNKVRIWSYSYWSPEDFLHPWSYTNGRFDLDAWNDAYWQRLRDFVAAAHRRGIMVEYTIFAANNVDDWDWSSTDFRIAWNENFNVNQVFSENSQGNFSPEFFDLSYEKVSSSGRTLKDYQQALLDKAVAELRQFDNVYFEVCNEFPGRDSNIDSVYPWQQFWASHLKQATTQLVSVHAHEYVGDQTTGIQYFWNETSVDIMDFHFSLDPGRISDLLHTAQTRNKILQHNEGGDPYTDLSAATRGAWGFFTAGGHYALYEDDSSRVGSTAWVNGATRLKVLHDLVDTLRFWEMSPVDSKGNEYDSLITDGPSGANYQVIANPGSQYLAYFWGSQSQTPVTIQLASGEYCYEWYDPRDGSALLTSAVTGSGKKVTIPAPSPSSWSADDGLVLIIRAGCR